MKRHLSFISALGMCFVALNITAHAQQVKADTGSIAIGGSVTGSTVIIGIPQEKVDELLRDAKRPLEELTAQQRETIALIKEKLDLTLNQARVALAIVGENDVPPELVPVKLVEIAEGFKALREKVSAQPGDDPKIAVLKTAAQTAIDAGELVKADSLLAEIETEQRRAHDRLALNEAETSARRGDIALTRLRYREAATHFGNAAASFPPASAYKDKWITYLRKEANALYKQGGELGDNGALLLAVERYKALLKITPHDRTPLDWTETQNDLGLALSSLGERETDTVNLEQAIVAFREALTEVSREHVPLRWAAIQNNLANALSSIGQRESGTAKLEEAAVVYQEALTGVTRERAPLYWAMIQHNLGFVLVRLGERERGTVKLERAVIAFREALKEQTRERVPLDWARTQNNLGNALVAIGVRESGTVKLEQAIVAFREALTARTRERAPLQWAIRSRAAVAFQVIEGFLGYVVAAVYAVHDLQGTKTRSFDGALLQPAHEVLGLVRHSEAQEGVQSKRRVAHPGIAIVPIAHPADLLGETARRCRDDRPGRREGQQLQHQSRAVDHLAPAAIVAALAHPAPPELECLRQQLGADEPRLRQPGVAITLDLAQDERRWLAGVQQELGGDSRALARQRKAADQREAHAGGLKHRTAAFQSDLMRPSRVIECGLAFEPEAHGPAYCPHHANDLMHLLAAAGILDRHEVDHLADPLRA
jgi:tetratricopeptide (TPR) repeat protein